MPVEVDVDSNVIELLVVLRLVDNKPMPVDVDVDSDVSELFVLLWLVDSDPMPVEIEVDNDVIELLADKSPVEVDVDRLSTAVLAANSCEPLIASVLVAEIWPAATFVTWRSAPKAPTLTTLVGVVPA
ncbi:conserved hypothetical protein [Burkholderia gladioli]|nr:conserved hypothetical protein [Burkholderia gladioli]